MLAAWTTVDSNASTALLNARRLERHEGVPKGRPPKGHNDDPLLPQRIALAIARTAVFRYVGRGESVHRRHRRVRLRERLVPPGLSVRRSGLVLTKQGLVKDPLLDGSVTEIAVPGQAAVGGGDAAAVDVLGCIDAEHFGAEVAAVELFGDAEGKLDLEALANAPRTAREEQELRDRRLLGELNLL